MPDLMQWNRTELCLQRLRKAKKLDEENLFGGRPLIYEDTLIDGGVYLGRNQREAIVVDSKKYPLINKVYELVLKCDAKNEDDWLLKAYNITNFVFPIRDPELVETFVKVQGLQQDQKVSLDVFIETGMGVCRHTGLLNGVLLEKLIIEGRLNGKVSIDRNSCFRGAHVWTRYTRANGEVIILDVAQNYFGTLADSVDRSSWSYARENEHIRLKS